MNLSEVYQCCRNSSDLSDNLTFFMNVWQKMLECQTKCPTKKYKNIHFVDEKKQNTDTDTDTLLTKKHGPRKALMTYMYRWHKCQFTRSHITNNKNIIVYINSNLYHNIWHFSHIILYQCINTSVSPCTLVCYTYWLTCRQKQGNAIYGVRTVISINIYHTKTY